MGEDGRKEGFHDPNEQASLSPGTDVDVATEEKRMLRKTDWVILPLVRS